MPNSLNKFDKIRVLGVASDVLYSHTSQVVLEVVPDFDRIGCIDGQGSRTSAL